MQVLAAGAAAHDRAVLLRRVIQNSLWLWLVGILKETVLRLCGPL